MNINRQELLERLLACSVSPKSSARMAARLMARFGHLSNVLDAPSSQLRKIKGMNPKGVDLLKRIKQTAEVYLLERIKKRKGISSSRTAIDISTIKLAGLPHEAFLVLYLNAKHELLHEEIISEGSVNRVMIYPRKIMETALVHQASAVILSHNHPSGDVTPSKEDKQLTREIQKVGRLLDIDVLDHIIVGRGDHASFRRRHLL